MIKSNSSRKSLNSSVILSPNSKDIPECSCLHCDHCYSKQEQVKYEISPSEISYKQNNIPVIPISNRNNNPEQSAKISQRKEKNILKKYTQQEIKRMKQIIQDNFDYYLEKVDGCHEVKSPKTQPKLPTKTGHTTYQTNFKKKHFEAEKPFKPNQIVYKPNFAFDPNSTYKQNYTSNEGIIVQSPQKILPKDNLKIQKAPRFLQTQYNDEFKKWKPESVEKYTPLNSAIFKAGEFDGRTIYKSSFQGTPTQLKKQNLTRNVSSNIFNGPKIPISSSYQNQFTKKPVEAKSKGLKKYSSTPYLIGATGEFKTQYGSSFKPQTKKDGSFKKQYNKEEIVNKILEL